MNRNNTAIIGGPRKPIANCSQRGAAPGLLIDCVPQGLKPYSRGGSCGTAEAVPLTKGYVVTAPCDALLTVLAYLAKTPLLKCGTGALTALRRAAISSAGTSSRNSRFGMSKVIVSPS